jgi:DNA-binding transcriptional LysR family regulator
MEWTDRIGRRLKPRDLHVFLTVLEHGSMAKAADRLAISRPVVSKTIAALEQMLKVRLFDRTAHGLVPTVYGSALHKRSVAVFDELHGTVRELEFLADPTAGEVRFGCTETLAAGLIPAVIDGLSCRHPRLLFRYDLGSSDVLLQGLRERKFEICVARMQADAAPADMQADMLLHEPIFVVTGRTSKWATRRKVALEELTTEPWILAPLEFGPMSPLAEAFRQKGLEMPPIAALGLSIPMRNILLTTGRFLTVMPASILRFGPQRDLLKVLPVTLPYWRFPVAIFTMKNRTVTPPVQLFIQALHQVAQGLMRGRDPRKR